MRLIPFLCILLLVSCTSQVKQDYDAKLSNFTGAVFVNSKDAKPGMELKKGDLINTGENAEATIVLYDSSVLRLGEKTEIAIAELSGSKVVQIKQTLGDTWTRVLRISGISHYEIVTPNTVATVRGTGFRVTIENDTTQVRVKEGKVRVAKVEKERIVAQLDVPEGRHATVGKAEEKATVYEHIVINALEKDEWIDQNVKEDEKFIEKAAERFEARHKELLEELNASGLDKREQKELIQDIAVGKLTKEKIEHIPERHLKKLEQEGIIVEPAGLESEDVHKDERILDETINRSATESDSKTQRRRMPIDRKAITRHKELVTERIDTTPEGTGHQTEEQIPLEHETNSETSESNTEDIRVEEPASEPSTKSAGALV